MPYKLVICVFGCVTVPKYRHQVEKINATWGKECTGDVKLLFFLGEEVVPDFAGDSYIYLPGVKNDYLSASYKQAYGLKYIHDHVDCAAVLCCGTDTFLNIPKLQHYVDNINLAEGLYIGGHGCHRQIGDKNYYYHSGGPGFILTKKSIEKLSPYMETCVEQWIDICNKTNKQDLLGACDVAISYFIQKYTDISIIKINDLSFIHCNHKGAPCHRGQIDMKQIISCHSMSLGDFDEFYRILIANNFFLV